MRTYLLLATLVTAAAACGRPAQVPRPPLGATEHLAEADRHDADARQHEELALDAERAGRATTYVCSDPVVTDISTSGGERLTPRSPCWSAEGRAVERHRAAAARLRADARAHRAMARQLLGGARDACAGLPEAELEHTIFAHHEDIAAVEAVLEGDLVRGARVRFERVPGLTADWVRQSLRCHQAMAAAGGYSPTYMPECPSVVAGAVTQVFDTPAGVVVEITSRDAAAALVIYGRAEDVLRDRTRGVDTRGGALAPCHTATGRVGTAATTALRTGNVRHALAWVDAAGAPEVQAVFKQVVAVYKKGGDPLVLAMLERHFIETVVRLHLAAHGEPYRGLATSCPAP